MREKMARLQLLGAMGIFGTIGIFRKFIPLSGAAIACVRGLMGVAFLLALMGFLGKKINWQAMKQKLWLVCLSGTAIGVNWVLLFQAYNYSVPLATVGYYMAPVFVILASPLVGERMTGKKLGCAAVAVAGMVLVAGVVGGIDVKGARPGVLLGLCAGVFYASVMLMNRKMGEVGVYDRTVVQLAMAAVVVLPYVLLTGGFGFAGLDSTGWVLLVIVGIVHTGVAYALYFGAMGKLKAQSVAILSYLDPVLAIILSAVVLRETMDIWQTVGAVLVLGSALVSELPERKRA